MRKLFFVLMCIMPTLGVAAVDVSDCEVIGFQRGTLTEKDCVTKEYCNKTFANFPDDLKICLKGAKTPEQCVEYAEKQNKRIEENNLVYKCPINDLRLKQKNQKKNHVVPDLVYTNGRIIDQESLANDTKYVYLFHAKTGYIGFTNRRKYSIIGPAEEYGLNMAIIQE